MHKHALWGFLFGSVGLFVLAMLSMTSTVFETLLTPLFWPGRALASAFVGDNGSDLAVLLLALANGLLYAAVFVAIGKLIALVRAPKK